ncbi:MAG: DUF3127 domain-containing protein [Rikenellaceae bacterium]
MEFEGKVSQILPAASGTSARGEWQRQEVIFEMQDGNFVRKVAVTFFNKPTEVAGLKMGETYTVQFNVESREYNGRWYTNLTAWRVMPKQMGDAPAAAAPFADGMPPMPSTQPAYSAPTSAAPASSNDVDDLPF